MTKDQGAGRKKSKRPCLAHAQKMRVARLGRLQQIAFYGANGGQLPPHHAGRDTVQASNTRGASAMVATMTALMVCRRFSASSKAILLGDSKTSSLTSMHSMPKR